MTPLEIGARALAQSDRGEDCYDALSKADQERLKGRVAALLLSLRRPSPAMKRAGMTVEIPGDYSISDLEAMLVWERMLDVAATEK
jgi:hypothetical protein